MDDKNIWCIYFASLTAMTLHPGYQRPDTEELSMKIIANLADDMLKITKEKFPCQSPPQ